MDNFDFLLDQVELMLEQERLRKRKKRLIFGAIILSIVLLTWLIV